MGIVKQIGEHSIVGNSQGIRDVFGVVEKAAASDSTVMIFGESGTGKELIARALHQIASAKVNPSLLLTVVQSRTSYWKVSCLGMKKVHLQVLRTHV